MKKIIVIFFIFLFPLLSSAQQNKKNTSKRVQYKYCAAQILTESRLLNRYDFSGNSQNIHDSLYDVVVWMLDEIYSMVQDDRVDSIHDFLSSRIRVTYPIQADTLGVWGAVNDNFRRTKATVINLCPLLEKEILTFGPSSDTAAGYYSSLQNLIVIYCPPQNRMFSFLIMATTIYHEGYHAWLDYQGKKYATAAEEHAVIEKLDDMLTDIILDSMLEIKTKE